MRRPKSAPPARRSESESSLPSLEVLEQFSLASLSRWKSAGKGGSEPCLFFGLERHRAVNAAALADAVRSQLSGPFRFEGWARVVDYRFALDPLSLEGSIRRDGGRFNIGAAIDPAAYTPFPALYLAEDFETAFRERFGIERTHKRAGLSAEELVLRGPGSFTSVELRGMVELVLDVGRREVLTPAASVLATFQMLRESADGGKSPWSQRTGVGTKCR